jgi:glycine cleavage system aminomethyltransferase T
MARLNLQKYQDDYRRSLEWDKPFYAERPAAFSPAAEAQENYGRNSMLYKFISQWIPWQYTDFIDESLSFHEAAYLGDWSSLTKFWIKGPDALKFLTRYCANDLAKFNHGQIKHAIQTDANGKVAGEGILYKIADDEYQYSGGGNYWLYHWFKQGKWDAEARVNSSDYFVFVIQGPKSLHVMEKVTGERFRDLKFSYTRMTRIGPYDWDTRFTARRSSATTSGTRSSRPERNVGCGSSAGGRCSSATSRAALRPSVGISGRPPRRWASRTRTGSIPPAAATNGTTCPN